MIIVISGVVQQQRLMVTRHVILRLHEEYRKQKHGIIRLVEQYIDTLT